MKLAGKIVLENTSFLKNKFNLKGTETKKNSQIYTRLFNQVKILVNKVLKLPQLVKSISQVVTAALKLIYKQIENCDFKSQNHSGVKTFWPIQNNQSATETINKINSAHKVI